MLNRNDLLDRYLAQERLKPFAWGRENGDCLLFLLGWAELCGRRASIHWRGTYDDQPGAFRRLAEHGGYEAAFADVMGGFSALPARRGDVGLANVSSSTFGAICTGKMWAFRAIEGGVGLGRMSISRIWNMGFSA